MTRMAGPDCAVMCNLINTHTHTLFSSLTKINDDELLSVLSPPHEVGRFHVPVQEAAAVHPLETLQHLHPSPVGEGERRGRGLR